MANYSASAALRKRLGIKPAPIPPPPIHAELFGDHTWKSSLELREMLDGLAATSRWHVAVIPEDRRVRHYWLIGSYESVKARASSFFVSAVVLIEPATIPLDAEIISNRLNLSTGR